MSELEATKEKEGVVATPDEAGQLPPLPTKMRVVYAIGQLGWSIAINIIGIQMVYFYFPPDGEDIPLFIGQQAYGGVINIIAILAAAGRCFDALTDPWIASRSDRSENPLGRRIPFMRYGFVGVAVFGTLIFVPLVGEISGVNVFWLFFTQIGFYFFLTLYVTPYFALLPELSRNDADRLNLSMMISITYALGTVFAGITPTVAAILHADGDGPAYVNCLQISFGIFNLIAMGCMALPAFTLEERKYCKGEPSNVPLIPALKETFQNVYFRYYVASDFTYFLALTLVNTGINYYTIVLLGLDTGMVAIQLTVLVLSSFLLYPLVTYLASAERLGKKKLIAGAFAWFGVLFVFTALLGDPLGFDPTLQAYMQVLLLSPCLAVLGVLPNAVLSDITVYDKLTTGVPKEGMFFAARTLLQKLGQTAGLFLFAILLSFGKDKDNDLGIRLSGAVGAVLCVIATLVFMMYNEMELMDTIKSEEGKLAAEKKAAV